MVPGFASRVSVANVTGSARVPVPPAVWWICGLEMIADGGELSTKPYRVTKAWMVLPPPGVGVGVGRGVVDGVGVGPVPPVTVILSMSGAHAEALENVIVLPPPALRWTVVVSVPTTLQPPLFENRIVFEVPFTLTAAERPASP